MVKYVLIRYLSWPFDAVAHRPILAALLMTIVAWILTRNIVIGLMIAVFVVMLMTMLRALFKLVFKEYPTDDQ